MNSLNDICYEQIKDNYWYGKFGKFKLIIDNNTGYFNATKLCQNGYKNFFHWKRLGRSKRLIRKCNKHLGPPHVEGLKIYYIVEQKGTNEIDFIISGTYVDRKLLLDIATWISDVFYFKCYDIVEDYFVSEYKNKMNKLSQEKEELESFINEVKDDISPKPQNKNKLQTLTIIDKNQDDIKGKYYVLKAMEENFERSIHRLKEKYPEMEIKFKFDYTPNAHTLYHRIKENLDYLECKYNHLNIDKDKTIDDLRKDIQHLHSFI